MADSKPINPDLAAVARALCAAETQGPCECHDATDCAAIDPEFPYMARAISVLAADPVRAAALKFLDDLAIVTRSLLTDRRDLSKFTRQIEDILARAATQVANE